MAKEYINLASLSIVFLNLFQKILTSWLFCDIFIVVIEMTIYERIKYLREKKGMSQQELAEKVGFKTASAVNKIELGLRDINQTKIIAFAKALDTTPGYIMGWENDQQSSKTRYLVPVIGSVPAGIPLEAIEDIIDYEEIPAEMAKAGEYFALRIRGDSMEPKFSEGDVVIVRKQEQVDNGQVAVVMINGDDATVKKFYKTDSGVMLVGNNPSFVPLTYTPEQVEQLPVRVIGRVVELRAKF